MTCSPKKALNCRHVRRNALNQVARLRFAVEAERQPLKVIEKLVAKLPGDAFGCPRREPPAQEGEEAFDQRQPDKRQRDQQHRPPNFVAQQHFINHVAQHQKRRRLRHCREGDRDQRADVQQAIARQHVPQAAQSLRNWFLFVRV